MVVAVAVAVAAAVAVVVDVFELTCSKQGQEPVKVVAEDVYDPMPKPSSA